MRNWGTSLPRPVRPRLRRRVTFTKSSANPTAPTPASVPRAIHTNRLGTSIQSKVARITEKRMSRPPIVGVPALARCVLGPSARIDWATWNFLSIRIVAGPSASERIRAVTAAIAVRNVM